MTSKNGYTLSDFVPAAVALLVTAVLITVCVMLDNMQPNRIHAKNFDECIISSDRIYQACVGLESKGKLRWHKHTCKDLYMYSLDVCYTKYRPGESMSDLIRTFERLEAALDELNQRMVYLHNEAHAMLGEEQ